MKIVQVPEHQHLVDIAGLLIMVNIVVLLIGLFGWWAVGGLVWWTIVTWGNEDDTLYFKKSQLVNIGE